MRFLYKELWANGSFHDELLSVHKTQTVSLTHQIGDENVHLVRCLLDEVFGAENFCSQVAYVTTTGASGNLLNKVNDFVLWYARGKEGVKYRPLYLQKDLAETAEGSYEWRQNDEGRRYKSEGGDGGRPYTLDNITSSRPLQEGDTRSFEFGGTRYAPGRGTFKSNHRGLSVLAAAQRLQPAGNTLRYVRFFDDFPVSPLSNVWTDTTIAGFGDPKIYVVQTGAKAIQRCLLMTTDPGDLVLDPTCGSGTTAYVAEQWGRRWITTDTSRVALALARTRIMAARYPYYILADSPEGVAKEAEISGKWSVVGGQPPKTEGDPRKGFVYKRVPHVTLKAIANNEEIDVIHAKWQQQLEPLREKLNGLLKQKWQEWEVPRAAEDGWPAGAKAVHQQYWQGRRDRQKEIDDSIARKAEMETLYDQPYEDNKKVRVSGPFTVESLSPHRTLSVPEKVKRATVPDENNRVVKVYGTNDFGQMILDNLRAAGVQNTRKAERLKFDSVAPYAGQWVHGEGKYTDADGKQKRAAICIGPEHGTVGPELIKEAAKEAVQGVGFDLLIVCGFAFDPHVSEESKRYGKLVVLPTRINPDLAMGELLKKTGAGNLFMVFGEPDVEVASGRWLVARNGRMIANYERVKELPGFGSLEEINRAGRDGISRLSAFSGGREIRADQPSKAGGGVGAGQHRRGSPAQHDGGVSAISGNSERLAGGDGNTADSGGQAGYARQGADAAAEAAGSRGRSDAQRIEALTALEGLSQSDFPLSLTTDHKSQVTIHGLDVYDPTTGQVRASTTDDIACWFIDTDYNGESFFVRHAYFTGAGEPYDKLKRALRAEIDEAAWSALYSTRSRPFDKPATGKIAIKVINHYGDEVLKVCAV